MFLIMCLTMEKKGGLNVLFAIFVLVPLGAGTKGNGFFSFLVSYGKGLFSFLLVG